MNKPNNPMREVKIEKVTLNIGVGEAGDKLNKAKKILEKITNSKAVQTITMKRIPSWGIRPKLPIGCKVTLRRKKAEELLIRLFKAIDNKIDQKKFDKTGNFSFGIQEYIDIPNVEYDPSIGIIGLEVAVTLEKPGYRIKRRRIKTRKIASNHLIDKEKAEEFIKNKFNIEIITGELE
jgi:large subunit ribosomal protein L5